MALRYRQFYKPEDKEKPIDRPADAEAVKEAAAGAEVKDSGLIPSLPGSVAVLERERPARDISERSFAVFAIGREWYAVDLDATLEILHSFEVVPVPHLPDTFSGVTNLRGESVPVVNLKKLLGNPGSGDGAQVCLIMLFGATKIGFLIDSDVEIVNAAQGKFYPLPDCYTRDEARFMEAVLWIGDRFVGMLKPGQALEVLTQWEPSAESRVGDQDKAQGEEATEEDAT